MPYYYSWSMLFSEANATHPIACGGHYRRIGCRVAVAVALQEQDDALEVQSIASGNTTINGNLVGEFSAKGHGFRVLDPSHRPYSVVDKGQLLGCCRAPYLSH